MTINNGIRIVRLVALISLVAGSALSAVRSDSQAAKATAGDKQLGGIEIVAPVGGETVGTIFFGMSSKDDELPFGGPH